MTDNIEILAPCGDKDSFLSAIGNGADAVYLGGSMFSARKNAVNFTNEELQEAVDYAHLRGVCVYVALNTLIHNYELVSAFEFIKFCYEIGVDALIIQDLGIVNLINKYFPDFRIHASTQMTIHNSFGVMEAKKLGFKRVVLSRELSYDEIKFITDKGICEIEVFGHGALCMCYSGQCLMSSFIGGRSGNRGACAQPCRLSYTVCDDSKNPIGAPFKYYMSLKDLCVVDDIKKFRELNVTSIKIEGRMKSAEYVAIVTSMYNKYRKNQQVDENDLKTLENVFSRNGFTKGYLYDKTGSEMLNIEKTNDDIYKNITDDVHKTARELMNNKKLSNVSVYVKVKNNEKPFLSIEYKNFKSEICGDSIVELAVKTPTDKDRILSQVTKLGGTAFVCNNINYDIDDDINIPIGTLNELRRKCVKNLEEKIVNSFKRQCKNSFDARELLDKSIDLDKNINPINSADVYSYEQAKKCYDIGFDRIYITLPVYNINKDFFDENSDIFVLKIPSIIRENAHDIYKNCNLTKICISNISQLSMFEGKELIGDFSLNVYNNLALEQYGNMGLKEICISPELNISEINNIKLPIKKEVIVYGKVPVMTVRNCLFKSANGKCGCNDGFYYLKDRKNMFFPFITNKYSCTNTIYNCVPIYMGDKENDITSLNAYSHKFIFTTENCDEIELIFNNYKNNKPLKNKEFTRGHFYKGV